MKASQLGQVKLDIDPLQAWFAGQVKPWAEYQETNVATLQDRVVRLETTVCRMELILESIIRRNFKMETHQEEKEEVEEENEDEGEANEVKQEQEEKANETGEVHEEEKGDNHDKVQEWQATETKTPSVDSIDVLTPNEKAAETKAAETKAPSVGPIDLLIPNENFYHQETDNTTKNGVVDSAASKVDVVDQEPIKSAKKNGVLVSNTKEANGEEPNLEPTNIKSGYEAFVREYVTFPEDASDLTREEAYWASSVTEESSPFRSIDVQDTSTEQTPPPSPVQPTSSSSSSVPHATPSRGVSFTASAASESGNIVVERRTKVVFVKEKEHMHLIGTGVRLLGAVSVYAVGVYAYKDFLQGTYKTATDIQHAVARHSLLVSLRLILRLKADRMARAFSAAVKPRYETYTSNGTDNMQAFHDIIVRAFENQKGVAKKKTEIEFFLSPTGVGLFVNRVHKGSIEDVRLRRAVSDIFFDEKAASPSLKKNCLDYFGGPVV